MSLHNRCAIHGIRMRCVYGNTVFCGACLGCKRGHDNADKHQHEFPPALWATKKVEIVIGPFK